MQLQQRTILITGGGSGIGLALAKKLSENNAVIICGRNIGKLNEAAKKNPKLIAIQCDISKRESVNRLVEEIRQKYSNLDFLINNAGIMRFWDLTDLNSNTEELQTEIQTNLTGTIQLTQSLLPVLFRHEKSSILNISSALAFVPMPVAPIYSAAKAALHSYTVSLRQQLEHTNIKVFELLPAAIDTEMAKAMKENLGTPNQNRDMSPEKLVELTVGALRKNRLEIRPGMANVLYKMHRLFPSFARKIIGAQSKQMLNKLKQVK